MKGETPGSPPEDSAVLGRTMDEEEGIRRSKIDWDQLILDLKKTTREFVDNVLENIIESIVITNLDGYLVLFNRHSEEMFGYRAHEVLNRHIVVLGAKDPDVLGHIRQNTSYHGEITLRTKDGRSFPAHVRCVPLTDEKDQPIAMVGVARDLTREKEKERIDREVARLEAFNKNVISSLNDGIKIINLHGVVTFVNKRLADLLEYEEGKLLGLHFSKVVSEEGHALFQEVIDSRGGLPGKNNFETSFVTRSGKKIPFWVNASAFLEGLVISGILIAANDISELQRLKEELFQSEKMSLIGTLASEVAHEINNPLGGLIMAVQMLLADLEANEWDPLAAEEELREIENDARRCKKITQKLLDFSRSVPEERTPLDLIKVTEEALLLVQRQSEIENISFSKSYSENLPPVRGNSNSLQQVIINVVKNARDAMPHGGKIALVTAMENGRDRNQWVRLSISDTGPGISPEIAGSLFAPFVTTKRRGKGTGLGLAVSKRIVEEHGGHILFDDKAGSGATFHILLPTMELKNPEGTDG
jgi:two-component system, NtrC family, sensor kinase